MGLFLCKCGNSNTKAKKHKHDSPTDKSESVVKHITTSEAFQAALSSAGQKNVVVDFYATWCGPCKIAAPIFKDLAKKYEDKSIALSVDVDETADLSAQCGISSMPTFHLYKSGEKVNQVVGLPNKQQLEKLFTM